MSEELDSIVEYSVNLKDQDEPQPLPMGEYHGVIRSSVRKESQRGTMYAEVGFFIGADQYPADFTEGNPEGMTIMYRRVGLEDNPQARYGTRKFIEAIGATLSKKIDVAEWVGLEGALDIVHNTFEGSTRPDIKKVRAA